MLFNKQHVAKKREFQPDDLVYAEYHKSNKKWMDSWKDCRAKRICQLQRVRSYTNQLRYRFDAEESFASQSIQLPWQVLLEEHIEFPNFEGDVVHVTT